MHITMPSRVTAACQVILGCFETLYMFVLFVPINVLGPLKGDALTPGVAFRWQL